MIECTKCDKSYAMRYIMYHFHKKTPHCKECLDQFEKEMNQRREKRMI